MGHSARWDTVWAGRSGRGRLASVLLAVALVAGPTAVLLPASPAGADETGASARAAGVPAGGADAAAPASDPVGSTEAADPNCKIPNTKVAHWECLWYFTGHDEVWVRPAEVRTVKVHVSGGVGGRGLTSGKTPDPSSSARGGTAGDVTATLDVSAVDSLTFKVADQGHPGDDGGVRAKGGWPDGGDGGTGDNFQNDGCSGGGSSQLFAGGTRLLWAAGGGGCGGYGGGVYREGGDAGSPPGAGFAPKPGVTGYSDTPNACRNEQGQGGAGSGGGAASVGAGGAAGTQGFYLTGTSCRRGTSGVPAQAGGAGAGGDGGNSEGGTQAGGGGGGGGGAYGGGGGGGGQHWGIKGNGGGGGGGGINWVASDPRLSEVTQSGGWPAGGRVEITYDIADTTTTLAATVTSPTPGGEPVPVTSIEAGATVTFTATVVAQTGGAPAGPVLFSDLVTGNGLCEGTAIPTTPVAGTAATSTASCTFTDHNPTPPQGACIPPPPADPPPPPVPASCSFNSARARTLVVIAGYQGGEATKKSSSGSLSFPVTPEPTTTKVAVGAEPSSIDITVAGAHSTHVPILGAVTVRDADDTTVEGCVDLPLTWADGSDGTVTCHVAPVPGRTRHLRASYSGATDTAGSTSDVVDLSAEKVDTTTSLTIADGPRAYGYPLIATAAVDPKAKGVTADGHVTFTDAVAGGAPVAVPGCEDLPTDAAGTVCTLARPVVGTHVLRASYAAGTQTNGSDSADASATVTIATPRATLAANPSGGASAGEPVALTAKVELSDGTTDHAAVTEGTITFTDGGVAIPGCTALAVDQPTVTCSFTPSFAAGTTTKHTLAARYLGSPNLAPLDLSPLAYAVGLAKTQTTLALVPPATPQVDAGTTVTVAATVATSVAGAAPDGTVSFFDNGQLAACPPRAVDPGGVARCTFTPSAGTSHALTAAYAPSANGTTAASSTTAPLTLTAGRYASQTAIAVTPPATATAPVVGTDITLTATVTGAASPAGLAPTGTVRFTDGGTSLAGCDATPLVPVASAAPPASTATCTLRLGGGTHQLGATYGGDTPTAPSVAPATGYEVQAAGTTTSVSATATGASELTVVATVAPTAGHAVPTGTVDLAVDGTATGACQGATLTAAAAGATASCTWTGDPSVTHELTAAFQPDTGDFTPSAGAATYQAPGACRPGETALWAALNKTPGGVIVADGHSRITAAVAAAPGSCSATPVPFTATSVSLFGGLLTGHGSGVLTAGAADGSVCLTDGSLDAPEWLRVPTLSITGPVCWSLSDAGGLGVATRGELTASSAEGAFPLVDLADAPATSSSFSFRRSALGTSELGLRFLAGPLDKPVLDLGLTVGQEGAFDGTLDTPGLVLFGQSTAKLHVHVAGGAGAPLTFEGSVTLGPIEITDGVTLDELTVRLSTDGFEVEGTASVGVGDHLLELTVAASVTDSQTWSLTVTAKAAEAWEPLPGLSLSPNITGTIARADGAYTFDLRAGDEGGTPLVTWKPAPGASIAVQTIRIANTEPDCAAVPDDGEHDEDLVLSFAGAVSFSSTTVAIGGCADLSIGAFHLQATADTIPLTSDVTLSEIELTADGAVGAGLALHGGGDADIKGHAVHLRFNLTSQGAFVVGASVDLAAWGVPVQGFVAFASAAVTGFDTGDPTVGDGGTVDLEAGLTAVATWTPSGGAGELLSKPAPDGLGLTGGGGIRFTAHISPAALSFTAEITNPGDLPFLSLPGGTSIDAAVLSFTHEGTANVLRLHLEATVGGATKVAVDLEIGLTDGTFTGEVDVEGLQLFGRDDIDLHGSIQRRAKDPGPGFEVVASVTGAVGSEADPIAVAPSVSFTRVELTLGTGGIHVVGQMVLAGRAGLTIDGSVYTKADPKAGFSAGGWSLEVTTSSLVPWTPTDGVTFTAELTGRIAKKSSTTPVTFLLDAAGAGGNDLFELAPAGAPVKLAVARVSVGNEFPGRDDCSTALGDLWLSVAGSLTATIAGKSGTATAEGCFDLTSGAMSVAADLSQLRVDLGGGVHINGPRFTIARAATTPPPAPGTSIYRVTAEVSIDLDLLGHPYSSPKPGSSSPRFTAQLTYTGGAFVVGVRANLGQYGLGGVGGDAFLYYASAPVQGFDTGDPSLSKVDPATGATTGGRIDLVQGINFAVRLTLPGSVSDGLSKTGDGVAAPKAAVTALGQIDTAAKAFTFKIQFKAGVGGQEIFHTGNGTRLTLDGGFLKFTVKAGEVSFGLGLSATLHLPAADDQSKPASDVRFTGELTVSTTGVIVSLQVGTCGAPAGSWHDAFGIPGLTVECAAIQGGVTYSGVPTVGFFGKVTGLPPKLANAIGYVQGAPMQFAFNLEPFMLSVSIGVKDSPNVALRPLQAFGQPDFIQVRYASLYVAPTAVTIGQTTFPAGFGIGFQASIAGVDLNILANVDPVKPSIAMHASVSEIKVGGMSFGPVVVDFAASSSDVHFNLDGTLHLGPGTVDIGPAIKIGGELEASVHVSISKSGIDAYFWGSADVQLSALLAQEVCFYGGVIPIPCNFQWRSTGFTLTLEPTGFSVNGNGIKLSAGGYSVTLPWKGGVSTATPDSDEARKERERLEEELRKGTDKAKVDAVAVSAPVLAVAADDSLAVAAPSASDEPMAEAPLAADLVVPTDALIAGSWVIAPPSGPNPAGDLPTGPTTEVVVDPAPVPPPADGLAPGEWSPTGGLADARTAAAIATLPDGRVLVAGGAGSDGPLATAEVFDPATGGWTPTGSMAQGRSGASVAVLRDGRVLVAGGSDAMQGAAGDHALASTELYDPATGRWSAGPSLAAARVHATGTVLADGSVLVAGGLGPDGPLASAQVLDPSGRAWRAVGSMTTARGLAAASRLADGRVLVAGGTGGGDAALASAELFDPGTGAWTATADLVDASMFDTATTMPDGRVLVAGSGTHGQVFDPATATWSVTGAFGTVRAQAAAVTLPDGDVMLVGGTAAGQVAGDAEIYDAATNAWQATTDLPVPTAAASAVVLTDGSVLEVGGSDRHDPIAAASIYRKVTVVAGPPLGPPDVLYAPKTPVMGIEVGPSLAIAGGLIVVGVVLVGGSRRRRRAASA